MEGAQKDERKKNRGDASFILRDVYAQYCGYNAKWSDICVCRYNTKYVATADIPKLCDIASEGRDNIGKSKNQQ